MKKFKLGIVGATGAVGQEILKLLQKREFPASEIKLLASSRSAGTEVEAMGGIHKIEETKPESFSDLDVAIFSAGSDNSIKFAHEAVKRDCVVIDNSSPSGWTTRHLLLFLRLMQMTWKSTRNHCQPKLFQCHRIDGNLSPAQKIWIKKILRIDLPGCIWCRGYGTNFFRSRSHRDGNRYSAPNAMPSVFPHPIAFNLIPHVDQFREDGYTKEELKMLMKPERSCPYPTSKSPAPAFGYLSIGLIPFR